MGETLVEINIGELVKKEFEGFWKSVYEKKEPCDLSFLMYKEEGSPENYYFIGAIHDIHGLFPINGNIAGNRIWFRRHQNKMGFDYPYHYDYEGEIEVTENGLYIIKGTWESPYPNRARGIFEIKEKITR